MLWKALLRLMEELDNDDLVGTLEVIIDKFGEHTTGYATALTKKLVNTHKRNSYPRN